MASWSTSTKTAQFLMADVSDDALQRLLEHASGQIWADAYLRHPGIWVSPSDGTAPHRATCAYCGTAQVYTTLKGGRECMGCGAPR